jgi:hypothetical protein
MAPRTPLTVGDFNIDIGNQGFAGEASTIRIGDSSAQTATFIAGISGATVTGGAALIVNSAGQSGDHLVVGALQARHPWHGRCERQADEFRYKADSPARSASLH